MLVGGRAELLMERNQRRTVLASLVALGLTFHVALGFAANTLSIYLQARRAQRPEVMTSEVEIDARPPPPPPPPEQPPPEPPRQAEPEPEPAHRPAPRPVAHNEPPPAPAPSRAAPVMVVDQEFSNDSQETVATGDNVNATGDTSSDGVMRDHGVTGARQGGTVNGTGTGVAPPPQPATPPPPDYSVHAALECDESDVQSEFPDAAREAGIANMVVRVRLAIDANGRITRVVALNDPGFGFTAAAERVVRNFCRITPARDRAGNTVAETIQSFRVTFVQE